MAAGTFTLYRANLDDLRIQDLLTAPVKLALVTSAYTPNAANNGHGLWADVSGNEIAAGNGYSAGGVALASMTTSLVTNGHNFDSANPTWNAVGGAIPAWRYGVMYVDATLWGKVKPLIGFFLGDSAPADVPATTAGNPLNVTVAAAGWFDATQA